MRTFAFTLESKIISFLPSSHARTDPDWQIGRILMKIVFDVQLFQFLFQCEMSAYDRQNMLILLLYFIEKINSDRLYIAKWYRRKYGDLNQKQWEKSWR